MGVVIRQSAKNVIITYAAFALGYLNTLIFYPLVLSKEEIGLVRMLINTSFFFATFASLGAANIPTRFFPYFRDPAKKHNGILFFILLLGAIGFSLFLLAFIVFREDIIKVYSGNADMLINYLYYLIPFTFIALYSNIFDSYIVIQQKPVVPNFLKEFLVRLLMTLGLVLLLLKSMNFDQFVIFVITSYGIVLASLIYYIRHENVLFLKPDLSVFRSGRLKSMLVFGGFILMGNASGTIIQNVDSLMLTAYKGLSSTGVYTIAFFIAAVIEIPKRSISQAVIPLISESNKNEDISKLEVLYKKSSLNQLIAGGLLFFVIWFNIDNIFRFIPNGQNFVEGKWVVFWIGMSKLFDMATGVNQEIVGTSKYYKIDLVFYTMLGVMGIITNMIFIPKYGMNGAAFASAFSIFFFNIVRFIFIKMVFKIQPFTINTLKTLLIAAAVIGVDAILPYAGNFISDILLRSIVISAVFLVPVIYFKVSEDINKIYDRVLFEIRKRIG